ncbi:hypothetical protein N7476_000288 [Penicillium atrosanguineum]|uniref:Alpha-galactosidase n=1 Tax=Penicillium atrosanguineum TaxID=1132637 RepID=A0A9W9QBR3_9EURO|nr:hypothetical protein N7476_000288 [Penicillium atrosanguineum]
MAIWCLLLVIQCHQTITNAANASSHMFNIVEKPGKSLQERSTGLYATVLGGNGMFADGWPSIDQWVGSIEAMFESKRDVISASCSRWGHKFDMVDAGMLEILNRDWENVTEDTRDEAQVLWSSTFGTNWET